MAMNYATKYSNVVDERFKEASFTESAVNKDYDWDGVASVVVYDVDTAQMNNYTASGANRYGTPGELGNGVQTLTVSQDRSFTYTIDRKNNQDTNMVMEAGTSLRRQVDEVVIPEVDMYRIGKMILNAGYVDSTAITTSNAYEKFLDARASIRKAKAPVNGVIGFVGTDFYKKIKRDTSFVKSGDISQNMLITGQVGRIDNIAIVEVPDTYLFGASFILTHPIATTACEKLVDYKTHDNPPGINGWLIEGRQRYDAFVRKNKVKAIAAQINEITPTLSAGTSATATVVDFDNIALARAVGFDIRYSSTATNTAKASVGDDLSAWSALPTSNIATTSASYKVAVALCNADKECVIPCVAVTAVVGE